MTDSQKKTTTMTLINIGFGSTLLLSRLIEIVSPDSAMTKRLIAEARGFGRLIDATYGRRTRSVMRMDSGHVVLSTIQPKTVAKRVAAERGTNA